jgi:hypothetical protein
LKTENAIETDETYIRATTENSINYMTLGEKDLALIHKTQQINENDDAVKTVKNSADQMVLQLFWHINNIEKSAFKPFLRALPKENLPMYLRIRPSELDQLEKEQFLYREIYNKRKAFMVRNPE